MRSITRTITLTIGIAPICTNDPVNHLDPSGLGFFSFLRKVFKILLVVAAVVAAVVGVLATAGALAPFVGVKFGLILLGLSALGFAQAFGPPWLQRGISVGLTAIGIYLRPPQIIWNLAEAGASSRSLASWISNVSAVTRFLAQEPLAKPRPEPAPEGSSAGKKLSPCVKKLLAPWFSEVNLDRIHTFDNMPIYVRGDAEGYTEGASIFFRHGIDQHSINGISLIGHELTHVRQEVRYPFTYAGRYAKAAGREILHGRDPAGPGNPFEKEAYDMEDAIWTDLQKKFGSKNPCP